MADRLGSRDSGLFAGLHSGFSKLSNQSLYNP